MRRSGVSLVIIAAPTLLVMIRTVFRKSTVRPCAVGEAPVFQNLEQDVEHLRMGLLDLIEQHDRRACAGRPR